MPITGPSRRWKSSRLSPGRAFTVLLLLLAIAGRIPLAAAVIEGVVLDNPTGRPLARAKVTLDRISGISIGQHATAIAGPDGRFQFSSLPEGAYFLKAERRGYAAGQYGQTRFDGAGTPIYLSEAGQFFSELRLRRLGVIAGEVVDENGLGMERQTVYALNADERPVRMSASAVTDDRGAYRLTGLRPGRYFVRTGPKTTEDGRSLLPTYAGQTTNAREAQRVLVQLDREVSVSPVEPTPGSLGSLTVSLSGAVAAKASLHHETGRYEANLAPGGSATFGDLGPGEYTLIAVSANGALGSYMSIQVGGGSLRVNLALRPLAELRVRPMVRAAQSPNPPPFSVLLRRKDPPDTAILTARSDDVLRLPPGEYEAAVSPPALYYVESMTSRPISAHPGRQIEFRVALAPNPGRIAGRVLTPDGHPAMGAPVYLDAADADLRARIQGPRTVRTTETGEYQFFGLPPGKYSLFSSYQIQDPSQAEPGQLKQRAVTVDEGLETKADLEI